MAVPITSHGTAIGGSSSTCSSERPRNCRRSSATAAMVPRGVAMAVVSRAIRMLFRLARRILALPASSMNQCVVPTNGSW